MAQRYRVIDAQGYGNSRSNKVTVYRTFSTRDQAAAFANKSAGYLAQESLLGEGFDPEEAWDWMDFAHRGAIDAGFIRNIA